ncbi:MAG: CapA family protein [Nitrospinaceae bacterium]|jgi:poly-gamma-glutamate capsule biosynthesis protein CapA/YwtB (metallophosphatase superfamily)|nr:CapA family protein [Nitrospinaceae bacterium]MBT3435803.1 CapA family protein [Nitrospinaceae bacterium]MBT4092350.1 CapA family protein [Nitrospinaceae bacterium]MBT4428917.1 CapA family protein [Nitrospinaceae bacterium]MBT5366581.1 CapA family protein [Nitrospinaceae bacterium]
MTNEVSENQIYLALAGDIEIHREDPEKVFDLILPELNKADIRFGGLEASMSEKGTATTGKITMRHHPDMIEGYIAGGFDTVAFASNHCMDYGLEPFVETMELLEKRGIAFSGSGRDIAEARTPVIIERKGVRVGFHTYVLNLPMGWGANPRKPGVAPIRQDPLFGPPYVDEDELEAMAEDIKKTRSHVDVLLTTFHWGSSQSRTMTLSQQAAAHTAIDAGADLIIGQHPHILQGIEIYKGKAICHALGNLVLDHDHPMFLPTVKESILVKCIIEDKKISRLSFVPVMIGEDGRPSIQNEGDEMCGVILGTMDRISKKLGTNLKISGNEATILGD